MRIYNANAEKRIDDLIKGSEEEPQKALEFLQQAQETLKQNFSSHYLDSSKQDTNRIKSKIKGYEKIIGCYQKLLERAGAIMPEIPGDLKEKFKLKENDFSKIYDKLRSYMQKNEDLEKAKENLKSNYEKLKEDNEHLDDKVSDLEVKVSDLEESQKELKDI